jgi:hypothetical protein
MNDDQEIDDAYHADRLRLLIAQRAKLPEAALPPAICFSVHLAATEATICFQSPSSLYSDHHACHCARDTED